MLLSEALLWHDAITILKFDPKKFLMIEPQNLG